MSSDADNSWIVLLGLYLWARAADVAPKVVKAVERAGADTYEALHPDEAHDHAIDVPANAMSTKALLRLMVDIGFANPRLAAAVARAESGGYPDAVGDQNTSFGLFQIHVPAHREYDRSQLLQPVANARAAYAISRGGTYWKPWTTYRTGAYKRFMR